MSGDGFVQHDVAVALTHAIMDIFKSVLRPEEFQDAMDETYAAVKAGLQAYDAQRAHVLSRLKPMQN
jgi:hypothetical protein